MATASFPPSDEIIDNFIGFVGPGLDRSRVVRILQYHNNDVEQAINAYFDNPDSSKYDQQNQNWDEGAFNSNRDGSNNNTGISFSIQAADELPPLLAYEGASAPSRPPSRTSNNRSPHNGMVFELSAEATASVPSISKPYDSNNDPELAEALRASLLPQESGITTTDKVFFGPANRSQYEQGKWDLVPVSTSTREILLDPEPEDRRRDLGAPAFLKPSTDDNRLAALLTIYHEIPMMREMFLDRTNVAASYGNDREWWTGKAIEIPTMTGGVEEDTAAFVHELQRLMAFLDKTDRSYGSAEALANLPFVRSFCRPDNDLETAVLDAYRTLFSSDNHGKIQRIFSRGVEGSEQQNSQEFAILQLALPRKDSHAETIYDVADKALWDSTSIDLNSSPFLAHIGDVITFRFIGGDESRKNGIIVPAVWYPDRYMHSGRQAALDMRLKKRKLETELTRKDALETSLTYHELRSGKRIKVQDMFKTALRHELDEIEGTSKEFRDSIEGSMLSSKRSINSQNLSEELHKLADRIDRKLIALNEERTKAKAELKELSKLYTKQSEDPDQPTLHRYTLRGVSTSKNTIYICRQAEPDLIDMDLGSEGSEVNRDQWWKIHYAASEAKPVNLEKVAEEKVLEAASESNTAMLVYASEKAMTSTQYMLPTPLDTFVRKDNAWFKHEFASSNSPISSPKSPTSPGKRKVDSSELSDEDLQERRYRSTLKVSDRDEDSSESGAQNPSGNLLEVTELNGNTNQELLIGIDPTLQETPFPSQEMQERGGMRLLSPMPMNGAELSRPIDIMDLDQVMEDDNIAQESGAVKHVGFMD